MYPYWVHGNSEYKNANGVNKNIVATVNHNKYKDVLLNHVLLKNVFLNDCDIQWIRLKEKS